MERGGRLKAAWGTGLLCRKCLCCARHAAASARLVLLRGAGPQLGHAPDLFQKPPAIKHFRAPNGGQALSRRRRPCRISAKSAFMGCPIQAKKVDVAAPEGPPSRGRAFFGVRIQVPCREVQSAVSQVQRGHYNSNPGPEPVGSHALPVPLPTWPALPARTFCLGS